MITKGCGVQGLQNGSISCIGVPGAVPSGIRAVLAENVATVLMDLEVASGNDQTFTHSPIRNTARMLMQFLPGTDFIFSGLSLIHISEPTRLGMISYAVFCLKKKKKKNR